MEQLLSTEEVAEILGVPARTLSTWAYTGRGPAFHRVGKYRRYRPADLERWLKANRREAVRR